MTTTEPAGRLREPLLPSFHRHEQLELNPHSPARRAPTYRCCPLRALSLFAALVLSATLSGTAGADWLRLQAPRFGVISQLDERATLAWSVEFDQFIDALHHLYAMEEQALPPLTIVLFASARDFAPYRNRTESGQADVSGFFGNMESWSVIGLAGRRSTAETRRVVYHEAVHWFASATAARLPLWFEEGLAEVFSTFEVTRGRGRWGAPPPGYIHYLNHMGLQSLEDFLRVSQDEALHGSPRFYPQAWAFVHYLLFGHVGAERERLMAYLRLIEQTDRETAFVTGFGKSYRQMTDELRAYLRGGRYGIAVVDLPAGDREMTVSRASPAAVEFALARLAVAGGNDELAREHTAAALTLAPGAAPVHELLAILAERAQDADGYNRALDMAMQLGSQDAAIYAGKGYQLLEQGRRENARLDELLAADTARAAADVFAQAITLQPRHKPAYEGLVLALLSVSTIDERDDVALATGRRFFPTDGLVLVGQAALERQRGNAREAISLLRRARVDPFELPARLRAPVTSVHDAWLLLWLGTELGRFAEANRFEEAHALLDEQLADPALPQSARRRVSALQADYAVYERLRAAHVALQEGRVLEARRALNELVNDPTVNTIARREARRLLESSRQD